VSGFQKYGIDHLSPSALNCWRETPGLWTLRYLAKVWDAGNPAMWRGTATERGVEALFRGSSIIDGIRFAQGEFEKLCMGEITDEITNEMSNIGPMVTQAADAIKKNHICNIAATQLKVETWLDGVSIPVIGYVDFTFMEGPDIDLKTTKACPSKPRPDHVRQVALYNKARERPAALLYVTDKKYAFYRPTQDDLDAAVAELTSAGRSLERFLSVMPDADTAIRSVPHNLDHYGYGDAAKAKIIELQEAF
jgi:hypothetical protein